MLASFTANHFRDNRLEDVVFIVLHVYLVLVTIYALARESIPHIIFIFVARCLSTVWALARFIVTFLVKTSLVRLVDQARCGSEDQFFGIDFFRHRHIAEGALLGGSVLSIVTEAYFAYKLCHIYNKRPWRAVQVSSEMRRMYRVLLGFSVVAQVAGIILPATMAFFVDQILNTYFSSIVKDHKYIYGAVLVFMAVGWFALRREWKRVTSVFLGFGVVFLCSLLAGLGSAMFIWTFTTWRFFGTLYICSVILIIAAVLLAALCRNNFDKNLDHYLMVQNRLSASDFPHAHFEKDNELDQCHIPDFWDPEQDRRSACEKVNCDSYPEKRYESD
ncbi:hypothetical protein A7U60_g6772 [Sanghuangporus baumii]|uniref:Uncharacterized protein n=1 Tax=Sanghuangporus baumii TaxID=108892 RepID=A0A9Q5HUD8_SANBA|nr:hypothetical protein A7U60_g6772 [Sanghuangporus baumii]